MIQKHCLLMAAVAALALPSLRAQEAPKTVPPNADLQALLDKGENLVLQPGKVYPIKQTLTFKKPNQSITTAGAKNLSDYAILRISGTGFAQIINTNNQDGVLLEYLVLDGNRYTYSAAGPTNLGGAPMVHLGGGTAKNQTIRNCVMMSTRSWSCLKLHEGGTGLVAENNIILGAGADIHGNGRDGRELAPGWGDGISCAAAGSIVRNNLIMDPTDGAIVVFGAPGTLIEENVIASVSRESLGGVNMVDPMKIYAIDGDENRTSYRGTILRNNLFDAFGARIHITVPMGTAVWAPRLRGKVLVGATVTGNKLTGGAAGYGFILNGVDEFTVTDNVSTASHSGLGEGEATPPDEPGAFLYTEGSTGNSKFQPEFKKSVRHLEHLLRCNRAPANIMGYRAYQYGEAEGKAIATAAYIEMVGRKPTAKELDYSVKWLNQAKASTDELRRNLMASQEFTSRFGFVPPEELHPYRLKLWLANLDQVRRDYFEKNGQFPSAKVLYAGAIAKLDRPVAKKKK